LGGEFDFVGGDDEREALESLLVAVKAVNTDSKWEELRKLLSPGAGFRIEGDKLLIFTQYRVTQSWLAERLTQVGESVMQIHGGLSLDERRDQRIAFESEGTVLISTEAGSEGANLHRKCHLLVNYDLPWNPMRLLQRIGRLDRYGQKHKVLVANLRSPESWDARISEKLNAKLASVQASMGLVADEDYQEMILGAAYEAINIGQVMEAAAWGSNEKALDAEVDKAVESILARKGKGTLDSLFKESLGMPENYGKGSPSLVADAFRQAFAWAAAGQGVMLQETRTSDKKFLRGVYHFTLPDAFRGGLRADRECYLVFDRDLFAEVRNETLGRVRGQEIKPSLAGFGDAVTDWFFKGALQARGGSSCYAMKRPAETEERQAWWVVFAGRWKGRGAWAGPDCVMVYAIDAEGAVLAEVEAAEVMRRLQVAEDASVADSTLVLPSLSAVMTAYRAVLLNLVPPGRQRETLHVAPLCVVALK
jgi:hypothetical protein